jgi:hypothetical protein
VVHKHKEIRWVLIHAHLIFLLPFISLVLYILITRNQNYYFTKREETMAKKDFGCGRNECTASSGICGSTTFGTGKLDNHGYWEFPCKKCEDVWEKEKKIKAKEVNKK